MCSGKELFVSQKSDPIDLGGPDGCQVRGGGRGSIFGKRFVGNMKGRRRSSGDCKKARFEKKMRKDEAMRLIMGGARGIYILGEKMGLEE